MRKLALLLAATLYSAAALAQAWRADLEFGQDGLGLILLICTGMAFFIVRDAYRESKAKGLVFGICALAIAVGAWFLPMVRTAMAWFALAFILYIAFIEIRRILRQ